MYLKKMYISFIYNSPRLGILNISKQEILDKLQHVHIVTFCSVIKEKHALLKHTTAWLNLQIMWNGQSQREDSAKLFMKFKNRQTVLMEIRLVVALRRGED